VLATHKGYHFLAWFLAGGLVGIIILVCLPDTVEVKTVMEPEEVIRLRKKGNYIGVIVSLVALVGGVLIALIRHSAR